MTRPEADAFPRFRTRESRARFLAAYDAALAAWPIPFEARLVETRFGPTHVVESGKPYGPALVLLPSLAAGATVWRPNVEALGRHFRTYAVDVIGQTGKSVALRRLRHRRDFALWFTDLLDGLHLQRASIVGCSFGGFLALNQASLTPQRVERVVMISPAGVFVSLPWWLGWAMLIGSLRRRVQRHLGDRRPPNIAALNGAGVPLSPEDAPWRALMSVTLRERARLNVITPAVLSPLELRSIQAPSLLLIGDQESLYDAKATLALAMERMPGLQGAVVADAHHIAAMAQPEAVNGRILDFLRSPDYAGNPATASALA